MNSTGLYELNRAIYADELGDLFQDYLKGTSKNTPTIFDLLESR